ncbi:MAG: AAA family ATPase, partial [Actinobacteria bacterium]|nr:AAA family ATPase [Actinomycetota bacterium]
MADDLFAAAAEERLSGRSPLAARLRPRNLDDVVGQRHLLAPGRPLRALIEGDRLSSVIFWGPPGTGKTSLSRLIASTTEKVFVELSAVTASVKDVREEIASARHRLGERGTGTILFLDEVHRFNKAQQDTLLPAVEEGLIVLIGATTENPHFEVNPPLMSRSTLFRLHALDETDIAELVKRGLEVEGASADDDAIEH